MATSSSSSTARRERPCKLAAFALLLAIPLLNGAMAFDTNSGRGDMNPQQTSAPDNSQKQVFPTVGLQGSTANPTATNSSKDGDDNGSNSATPQVVTIKGIIFTDKPTGKPETPAPLPPRDDSPNNKPKEDVICVSKEAVDGKNAVSLKLRAKQSNCKTTQMKIENVLQELCGEDCKLEIYQEDYTDEVLVSGKYVEDDLTGMTGKFNNDNIKDKVHIEEAVPRWGKRSKLVLVSMLLAGLLLAALLVAGYCLKTHRKSSKGVRLAESFQVDEENQANTLVSVAPLPQEQVDKPTVNGESPPEHGTNSAPTTNGHSANQTQVADTEM